MYFSWADWINLMYFSSDEVAVRCSPVLLISPVQKYSWSLFDCFRGGIMFFPPRKTFLLVSFLWGFVYFLFDEVAVVDLLVLLLLPPCTTLLLWYTSKCTAAAAAAATLPQSAAAYIGALFAAPVASWHRICCCTPLAPSPRHHTCTLSHLQIKSTSHLQIQRISQLQILSQSQNSSTCRNSQLHIITLILSLALSPHVHIITLTQFYTSILPQI